MEQRVPGDAADLGRAVHRAARPEALQPAHRPVRARRHHLEHLLRLDARQRLPRAGGDGPGRAVPRRRSRSSRRGRRRRASRSTRSWRSSRRCSPRATRTSVTAPAGTDVDPGRRRSVMGSDEHYPEEAPAHSVAVDGFWIDAVAGDQRAVRRVRRGDRLRHRRRAAARPGRLPGRAGREPRARLAGVHAARAGRSTCGTSASGGHGRRARAGGTRRGRDRSIDGRERPPGRARRLRGRRGVRRLGRASAARPRPSGSTPRAAAWTAPRTPGATSPRRRASALANYWHGDFPWRAGARLRHDGAGRLVPAQRLRALRHGRQRLGVDDRLVHGAPPRGRRTSRAACRANPRGGDRAREPRPRPAAVPRSGAR